MKDSRFYPQVDLLLDVLPHVAAEKIFAMKGGTAINLFVQTMPRLSVDIDLTYLPIKPREDSLREIGDGILRIKDNIQRTVRGTRVVPVTVGGTKSPSGLTVERAAVRIKVEVNLILRGSLFPTQTLELCTEAKDPFERFVRVPVVSTADLYGGKICAALDRQHPRDFFDLMMLHRSSGVTEDIRKAFLIYLISHDRPMNELLDPTWKDIASVFEKEFRGMPRDEVALSELLKARDLTLKMIREQLTDSERKFLLSIKSGEPDWTLHGIPGVEALPGVQWKLLNIRKMSADKRVTALQKLNSSLSLS